MALCRSWRVRQCQDQDRNRPADQPPGRGQQVTRSPPSIPAIASEWQSCRRCRPYFLKPRTTNFSLNSSSSPPLPRPSPSLHLALTNQRPYPLIRFPYAARAAHISKRQGNHALPPPPGRGTCRRTRASWRPRGRPSPSSSSTTPRQGLGLKDDIIYYYSHIYYK